MLAFWVEPVWTVVVFCFSVHIRRCNRGENFLLAPMNCVPLLIKCHWIYYSLIYTNNTISSHCIYLLKPFHLIKYSILSFLTLLFKIFSTKYILSSTFELETSESKDFTLLFEDILFLLIYAKIKKGFNEKCVCLKSRV